MNWWCFRGCSIATVNQHESSVLDLNLASFITSNFWHTGVTVIYAPDTFPRVSGHVLSCTFQVTAVYEVLATANENGSQITCHAGNGNRLFLRNLRWLLYEMLYEIDCNHIAMGHPDFCLICRPHNLQSVTWIIWVTRTYQLCGSLEAASFLHQLTCVFIIDNYAIYRAEV